MLDDRDLLSQGGQIPLPDINPIHQDLAGSDVVDPVDQLRQGGLAGAGLAHDRQGLARADLEGQIAQGDLVFAVAEADLPEFELTPHPSGVPGLILVELSLAQD